MSEVTKVRLTKGEKVILRYIREHAETQCGAESADDLLGDNFSFFWISDLRENGCILSTETIKGILGSLNKKGICGVDGNEGYLTEKGILTAYELRDNPNDYVFEIKEEG